MAFIETRTMRYALLFITLLCAAAVVTVGCTKEDLEPLPEPAAPGETRFRLAVASYEVNAGTRAAEPSPQPEQASEAEKAIRDFWLFQFKADGSQLAAPKYYALANYAGGMSAMLEQAFTDLTKGTPMTIYVVTNTGDGTWATQTPADFDTLDKVKAQKLPNPKPIRIMADAERSDELYIPMSGQLDEITVTADTFVVVPVIRMYAKVKILATFHEASMNIYDVDVKGIPWYCRVAPVGTLDANGEPAAVPFPEGTTMISRAFSSTDAVAADADGTKWLVLYIPENIRGEIAEADKKSGVSIPEKSLEVHIRAKYDGMDYYFTVYPGENTENNFNIRRNCVYRVAVDIKNIEDLHTPSSNCFVVKPGKKLTFEPYYRVETGGGYHFADYLTPDNPDKAIETVEIIWQTKDCIGDNTKGDLVQFELNESDPIHSKIIVYTGNTEPASDDSKGGNALIGARNAKGAIVWSWHIWVTDNEPDNLGNALVYTTYRWGTKVTVKERRWTGGTVWNPQYEIVEVEKDGLKVYADEPRIPGYAVMQCNLGALAFVGKTGSKVAYQAEFGESECRTFGMLYQWGRKDPFPPATHYTEGSGYTGTKYFETVDGKNITYAAGFLPYSNKFTDEHYGNDNQAIVGKTNTVQEGGEDSSNLFYSKASLAIPNTGNGIVDGIAYSIGHPTVYISPKNGDKYNNNEGDWLPSGHSATLWGGEEEGTRKAPIGEITEQSIPFTGITTSDIVYYKYEGSNQQVYLRDNYGTQKSIFDPCPSGWRVAPAELWLGFTSTGLDPTTDNAAMPEVNWDMNESGVFGMMMYMRDWGNGPKSYFPLQGMRINDGQIFSTGWCGNYNNATCDGSFVNVLHLHQNYSGAKRFHVFEYTNWEYFVKSTATPLRCVRDSK